MALHPVVGLLIFNAIIGIVLIVYERLTRRIDRRFASFPWTVAMLDLWILCYAVELAAADRAVKLLFANIQFVGIGSVPPLLFLMIRQFLGRPPMRRAFGPLAAVIPIVTVAAAFTDGRFGLLRQSVSMVSAGGLVQLSVDYGLWHDAVFVPFQYGFYLASLALLASAAMRSAPVFRARLWIFAAALALPMLGGGLYVLNIRPFDTFNPTSVLIMVSFVLFGIVMLRHHIHDVAPVARHQVLDALDEGIIVLDTEDRVAEFNAAAARFFPSLNAAAPGRLFSDLLGDSDALLALARGIDGDGVGFGVDGPSGPRRFLGRSRPVIGLDGTRIGRLVTIVDTTEQSEDQDSESGLMSHDRFFRYLTAEVAKSRQYDRRLHLAVLAMPPESRDGVVGAVSERILRQLLPWERACFLGHGRFLVSMPEQDLDGVLIRSRNLVNDVRHEESKARIGLAGLRSESDESAERLTARAVRAVERSRSLVSYAR